MTFKEGTSKSACWAVLDVLGVDGGVNKEETKSSGVLGIASCSMDSTRVQRASREDRYAGRLFSKFATVVRN